MKVLVSGGAGFIGSHVVDYLMSLGHDAVVADNFFSGKDHWVGKSKRPAIEDVDILDRVRLSEVFDAHRPRVVIHLAAHHYIPYCEKHPLAAYDLNVVGTLNVLHQSHRSGVEHLFYASTADVYAPSPRPHMEDDALGPFTVYGRTKLIGEIMCRGTIDWGFRTNLLIGRLFNAVGTRETNPHLVPEVVGQIARGAAELHLGNLFPTRDFVDLDTQSKAIVDATLAVQGMETVNICSGTSVRVGELIDLILTEAGRKIAVLQDPAKVRAAERTNLCGTTDRLVRMIGYAPRPAGTECIRAILEEARAKAAAA